MVQAVEHGRLDFDAHNAACIGSLQDAVETVLLLVAEKTGAKVSEKATFEGYFSAINAAIAPAQLPSHTAMLRMNRLRREAKHAGNFPPHQRVAELLPLVKEFLIDVCEQHLEVSWHVANLSSIVQDKAQRDFIKSAEDALTIKDYKGALTLARQAFYLAFELAYDVSRFNTDRPLNIFDTLGNDAPAYAQSKSYINEKVNDAFGFIVIDNAKLDAKLIKLGIDTTAFWNVWRLSPAVYRFSDGRWVVKNELAKLERPGLDNDALYVVESVTEMILRKEQIERRLKVTPPPSAWQFNVHPGGRIFEKADENSPVKRELDGSETLSVVAGTSGVNGEPSWWEVYLAGQGEFFYGYLKEADVLR